MMHRSLGCISVLAFETTGSLPPRRKTFYSTDGYFIPVAADFGELVAIAQAIVD